MKDNIKVLNMQMPKELYEQLQLFAKQRHISLAAAVRFILAERLETREN